MTSKNQWYLICKYNVYTHAVFFLHTCWTFSKIHACLLPVTRGSLLSRSFKMSWVLERRPQFKRSVLPTFHENTHQASVNAVTHIYIFRCIYIYISFQCIYICDILYIYTYICVYIYIYIYSPCMYVYIYIHT